MDSVENHIGHTRAGPLRNLVDYTKVGSVNEYGNYAVSGSVDSLFDHTGTSRMLDNLVHYSGAGSVDNVVDCAGARTRTVDDFVDYSGSEPETDQVRDPDASDFVLSLFVTALRLVVAGKLWQPQHVSSPQLQYHCQHSLSTIGIRKTYRLLAEK